MSQPVLKKPAYSMSRRSFWISFVAAWCVIFALTWGALRGNAEAVAMATITVPSMVGVILGLLGIHRAYGSADMRTIAEADTPDRLGA